MWAIGSCRTRLAPADVVIAKLQNLAALQAIDVHVL
jgi:hypothetical protein